MSKTKKKLLEWLHRYGPAELSGTLTAITAAFLVHKLNANEIVTAYTGSIAESIGFYAVMIRKEHRRDAKGHPWQTARNLFLEFGPSEVLDSFATRPFFMGMGLHFLGPAWGLLAGKLMADFIFYIPSIAIYEYRKIRDNV